MRILVTGGAGFLGSHLARTLVRCNASVVVLDNLSTSDGSNMSDLIGRPGFRFVEADICSRPDVGGPFDGIAHLACPASPEEYQRLALETLAIGSHGSEFVLGLAEDYGCRVMLASTSEVYGDPSVSPQYEDYWGHVNPIGPRSMYDESKRYAEALFTAHRQTRNTNAGIVRIFNTYGPGLRPRDGRVVSNLIAQALAGDDLTIYGNGNQTRSFCFVSDLIRGLVAMLLSDDPGPVNLGNPTEITILELAARVLELTGSTSGVRHQPALIDDPIRRRPDITRARHRLGWTPRVSLEDGLRRTIAWQRSLGTDHSHEHQMRGVENV